MNGSFGFAEGAGEGAETLAEALGEVLGEALPAPESLPPLQAASEKAIRPLSAPANVLFHPLLFTLPLLNR